MVVKELVPFSFFESHGFKLLNGDMAKQLKVNNDRDSVRKMIMSAANVRNNQLVQEMKDKLIFVKLDAATRLRSNYLAVNVQYTANNLDW